MTLMFAARLQIAHQPLSLIMLAALVLNVNLMSNAQDLVYLKFASLQDVQIHRLL